MSTQKERLHWALKSLTIDVTPDDRRACIQELKLSRGTISAYLNGKVLDNDTGVKILAFLRTRVPFSARRY